MCALMQRGLANECFRVFLLKILSTQQHTTSSSKLIYSFINK